MQFDTSKTIFIKCKNRSQMSKYMKKENNISTSKLI